MKDIKIISKKLITTPFDLMNESFIDFNRLNGCFKSPAEAIRNIFSWFDHRATMTIVDIFIFHDAPKRNDFPGWNHIGNHSSLGKLYWNWFFLNHPDGELHFGDSPDFYGNFADGQMFWGDIGRVSASAFALTQKGMGIGDLWISILGDGVRQIVIESHTDVYQQIYGVSEQ